MSLRRHTYGFSVFRWRPDAIGSIRRTPVAMKTQRYIAIIAHCRRLSLNCCNHSAEQRRTHGSAFQLQPDRSRREVAKSVRLESVLVPFRCPCAPVVDSSSSRNIKPRCSNAFSASSRSDDRQTLWSSVQFFFGAVDQPKAFVFSQTNSVLVITKETIYLLKNTFRRGIIIALWLREKREWSFIESKQNEKIN